MPESMIEDYTGETLRRHICVNFGGFSVTFDMSVISSADLQDLLRGHAQKGDVQFHLVTEAWSEDSWNSLGFDCFPPDQPLPVLLICDLSSRATSRAAIERLVLRGAHVMHLSGQRDGLWALAFPREIPLPGDQWASWDFAFCGTLTLPVPKFSAVAPMLFSVDPRAHRWAMQRFEMAKGMAVAVDPDLSNVVDKFASRHAENGVVRLHMIRLAASNDPELSPISLQLWLKDDGTPVWRGVSFGCLGGLSARSDHQEPFMLKSGGLMDFGTGQVDSSWRDVETNLAQGRAFVVGEYFTIKFPDEPPAVYRVASLTAI